MPILPFNSVIIESPRIELPEGPVLTHFEMRPTVPVPSTAGGEAEVAATVICTPLPFALAYLIDAISESPARFAGRADAKRCKR
jgi:hypothetical protein